MNLVFTKKQKFVLELIQKQVANEILFGGAAGGGKSWLLRALAIIWAIQVPGVQIFLFRRKVKDLVATHMRGSTGFPMLLKEFQDDKLCKINTSSNYIEFDTGSIISLNHCQHNADLNNFLSAEFNILLLDESTTFTEKMVRFLRGRMRIGSLNVPPEYRGCLPFAVYGTNPRGESHLYFKSKFVDAEEPNKTFIAPRDDGGMRRCFVPSLLEDNPHIEEDYEDKLYGLGDPDVVEAYRTGDWSVVEGAALPTLSRKYHIVPYKLCSKSWPVKRAYDYGFSAPYFVIWYMICNGESESRLCPPKGSIIIHTCIYGANKRDEGLKEDVAVTAKKMKMHESLHYPYLFVKPGPADNSIFDKEQGPSIAEDISEACPTIEFTSSNKNPGSRVLGLAAIRTLLFNAIHFRYEKPGLYFTEMANIVFTQLAALQTDEKNIEDVNTDQNDHSYDVTRYIVLDKSKEIKTSRVQGS